MKDKSLFAVIMNDKFLYALIMKGELNANTVNER